jgi:hypothetical protein
VFSVQVVQFVVEAAGTVAMLREPMLHRMLENGQAAPTPSAVTVDEYELLMGCDGQWAGTTELIGTATF